MLDVHLVLQFIYYISNGIFIYFKQASKFPSNYLEKLQKIYNYSYLIQYIKLVREIINMNIMSV